MEFTTEEQKEKIAHCLEAVCNSLYAAKRYNELWWVLRGENTRPKYVNIMNRYNFLFRSLIGATFDAAIVALYTILEKRKDSYHIHRLFDLLKEQGIDTDLWKNKLEKCKKSVKGIIILRNNYVGHKSLSYKEAFKEAGIKPDEWNNLIKDLVNITSEVHYFLYKIDYLNFFADKSAKELEEMYQDLMKYHTYKEK